MLSTLNSIYLCRARARALLRKRICTVSVLSLKKRPSGIENVQLWAAGRYGSGRLVYGTCETSPGEWVELNCTLVFGLRGIWNLGNLCYWPPTNGHALAASYPDRGNRTDVAPAWNILRVDVALSCNRGCVDVTLPHNGRLPSTALSPSSDASATFYFGGLDPTTFTSLLVHIVWHALLLSPVDCYMIQFSITFCLCVKISE